MFPLRFIEKSWGKEEKGIYMWNIILPCRSHGDSEDFSFGLRH